MTETERRTDMYRYTNKESQTYRVRAICYLVARMVICLREDDGALVTVHASELVAVEK